MRNDDFARGMFAAIVFDAISFSNRVVGGARMIDQPIPTIERNEIEKVIKALRENADSLEALIAEVANELAA